MFIYDGDVVLDNVRFFHDGNGSKTGLYGVFRVNAADTEQTEPNPLFGGQSYFQLELSLHGPEVVDTLHVGDTLHITIGQPGQETEQWQEH